MMGEAERVPERWRRVLSREVVTAGNGAAVFPERIFRALELTPPEDVRAVILGQDPYPTPGHANGLCFSVNPDVSPLPRSLGNIFREYTADLGYPTPSCGDLTPWASRGVLLLNAVLTVDAGHPNSHRKLGWHAVTDAVLRTCLELPQPVVFLLWGREAQSAYQRTAASMTEPSDGEAVPLDKYALRSSHPSPLGASKPCGDSPAFLGSRPFSGANRLLGTAAVDWRLP